MQELEKILEEINAEFDRRINTQLKIMARLSNNIYRYGYGKSLEAYEQGKLIAEEILRKYTKVGLNEAQHRQPPQPGGNQG